MNNKINGETKADTFSVRFFLLGRNVLRCIYHWIWTSSPLFSAEIHKNRQRRSQSLLGADSFVATAARGSEMTEYTVSLFIRYSHLTSETQRQWKRNDTHNNYKCLTNRSLREDIIANLTQILFPPLTTWIGDALFFISNRLMTTVSINIRLLATLSLFQVGCKKRGRTSCADFIPMRSH